MTGEWLEKRLNEGWKGCLALVLGIFVVFLMYFVRMNGPNILYLGQTYNGACFLFEKIFPWSGISKKGGIAFVGVFWQALFFILAGIPLLIGGLIALLDRFFLLPIVAYPIITWVIVKIIYLIKVLVVGLFKFVIIIGLFIRHIYEKKARKKQGSEEEEFSKNKKSQWAKMRWDKIGCILVSIGMVFVFLGLMEREEGVAGKVCDLTTWLVGWNFWGGSKEGTDRPEAHWIDEEWDPEKPLAKLIPGKDQTVDFPDGYLSDWIQNCEIEIIESTMGETFCVDWWRGDFNRVWRTYVTSIQSFREQAPQGAPGLAFRIVACQGANRIMTRRAPLQMDESSR